MAKKTKKPACVASNVIDARARFARRAAQQEHLTRAVASAYAKFQVLRQATADMAALIASADDTQDPAQLLEDVHAIMAGPVGGAMVDAQDERDELRLRANGRNKE